MDVSKSRRMMLHPERPSKMVAIHNKTLYVIGLEGLSWLRG